MCLAYQTSYANQSVAGLVQYFSLADTTVSSAIQTSLRSMHQATTLKNIMKWADALCTVYDVTMEIRSVILGDGSVADVIGALLKGVVVGFMVDGMCKTALGIILKPVMAIFGLSSQVDQIQEAIEKGDPEEIAVRFVQLICMLFGLTSQCFTGDTLVATETGLRPIEELREGDYVYAENTETGEKERKKVTDVIVTMTDSLVYVETQDGTVIKTTQNHPFYVEGEGWKAAAELESGEKLRTKEGRTEIVAEVSEEKLDKPVRVYNLTIEDYHTYYVSEQKVLVHNENCVDVVEGNSTSVQLTAGKNVKSHYKDHKGLLEAVLNKKYPKFKNSNNAEEFLNDLSGMINIGALKYSYKSTAMRDGDILNIYIGNGLVLATKQNNEWVTLLEEGKGMAIQFEMFKLLDN